MSLDDPCMSPLDARRAGSLTRGASFSLGNRMHRAAWMLCWTFLAAWTPPPLHPWRVLVLRLFGAQIGRGVRIYGSIRIWHPANLRIDDFAIVGPRVNCYNQGTISIGQHAVVSQGAHLCASTHDPADPLFQLILKPISIGARAWIAADAFVGPGVDVGEGALLGARAAAFRALDPWTIYRGNPAIAVRPRVMRVETM